MPSSLRAGCPIYHPGYTSCTPPGYTTLYATRVHTVLRHGVYASSNSLDFPRSPDRPASREAGPSRGALLSLGSAAGPALRTGPSARFDSFDSFDARVPAPRGTGTVLGEAPTGRPPEEPAFLASFDSFDSFDRWASLTALTVFDRFRPGP